MKYKASLEVYENPEAAYKCLLPEKSKRSSFTLKREKDHLRINISAEDITALRAALNSITQLLAVHKQMGEIK